MTKQLALLLSLVGCASQVDGNHQGTALAKLAGTVASERTLATPDAEVDLVWLTDNPMGDTAVAEPAPITGDFPAAFHLSIYSPPSDASLTSIDASLKIGVAYIIAARAGANLTEPDPSAIYGMDENHVLVYLSADVAADSLVGALLHGAQTAGYHVYGGHHLTDAERMQRQMCIDALPADHEDIDIYTQCGGSAILDDLLPLADDTATDLGVRLVDDFDTLVPINWK